MIRFFLPGLLITVLIAGACGGSPGIPVGPDGKPDPQLVAGRDVFGRQCATCHGDDGEGGRGPQLTGGATVEKYPDPEVQRGIIVGGRNGMPAFGGTLSAAEVDAVLRYTREVL